MTFIDALRNMLSSNDGRIISTASEINQFRVNGGNLEHRQSSQNSWKPNDGFYDLEYKITYEKRVLSNVLPSYELGLPIMRRGASKSFCKCNGDNLNLTPEDILADDWVVVYDK